MHQYPWHTSLSPLDFGWKSRRLRLRLRCLELLHCFTRASIRQPKTPSGVFRWRCRFLQTSQSPAGSLLALCSDKLGGWFHACDQSVTVTTIVTMTAVMSSVQQSADGMLPPFREVVSAVTFLVFHVTGLSDSIKVTNGLKDHEQDHVMSHVIRAVWGKVTPQIALRMSLA